MYKLFERQNESKDDNQSDEISFAITRQNICEIFLDSGTKRKLLTLRLKKGMFVISMWITVNWWKMFGKWTEIRDATSFVLERREAKIQFILHMEYE